MGVATAIEERLRAWEGVREQFLDIITAIAKDHEPEIAKVQKQQLYEGKNSEGKPLRKYRSPKYARVKHEMNPLPGLGNPDLFVTGDFHRSIFAKVTQRAIIFDADDYKVEELVRKYGEEIFGLHRENGHRVWMEILRPPLLPIIAKMTHTQLK